MQNYPSSPTQSPLVTPSSDEKLMAVLSHLSLLVPHAGIIAPLFIWLLNQGKAPFAAYQARQALFFHLFVIAATWVIGIISFLIAVLTLGFGLIVLIPLLGVLSLIPMVCGIIGAIHAYEGRDFRYPIIGELVQP